jgi:hypothetical protein
MSREKIVLAVATWRVICTVGVVLVGGNLRLLAGVLSGQEGQSSTSPTSPLEVVKFRIEADLSRLLDRKPSPFTADNPDVPTTISDTLQYSNPRRRSVRQAEARERGRSRTQVRVIGEAETITLTVRNRGTSTIRSFVWDFAFPRYVGGKLVTRQQVTSRVEIKPGAKKTVEYPLPMGARRCQTIVVRPEASGEKGGESVFEAVCGPGFQDSSGLEEPTVLIRQVEEAGPKAPSPQ